MQIISSRKPTTLFRKVAIFGRPGRGKSMLAATCRKPLVILTEPGGADSLTEDNIRKVFGPPKTTDAIVKELLADKELGFTKETAAAYAPHCAICYDIPRIEAFDKKTLDEAVTFVTSDSDAAKEYETIMLDSATQATEILLAWALTVTITKAGKENPLKAYGKMSEEFKKLNDRLLMSRKNYVALFQARELKQPTSNEEDAPVVTYLVPGVAGRKSMMQLPHSFGSVWSVDYRIADSGEREHFIRTQPADALGYEKSRGAGLEDIEPFHLGEVFYRWQKA